MAKFVMRVEEVFTAEIIVEAEDQDAAYELVESLVADDVIDLTERKPYSRYSLEVNNLGDANKYLSMWHNWMPNENKVYSEKDLDEEDLDDEEMSEV